MAPLAVIVGCSGPVLTAEERVFFRDANPWGFILFSRNVETPSQVSRLCAGLREAVGRDCLIFVDQEVGRVQRLKAPHWKAYPSGAKLAALYQRDAGQGLEACYLSYRLIADDLRSVGITANCAPVLDLPQPDADPIISDRAFGTNTPQIIDLAHASMAGLMKGGVVPVVKHIPGHGRARVDSHKALPKIDENFSQLCQTDFVPFKQLNDAPMAMTAHAVYSCTSGEAITVSPKAFDTLIRAEIGYDGLVMTDDLDMKALSGNLVRKTEQSLAAGCDIALQCSGQIDAMVKVAKGARPLIGKALERAKIAQNCTDYASEFEREAAEVKLSTLMQGVADVDIARAPMSLVEST
ncbi:MAG: beta-N-acetylhexosaminidase [Litorimonas sp.]